MICLYSVSMQFFLINIVQSMRQESVEFADSNT